MAEVALGEVSKVFPNGVAAVRDFSLDVGEGERIVLLGPSGCGKTTLLRLIAGLERPSSGRILIGRRLVNDVPPRDRDVAFMFQRPALYPHLTVRRNLEFGVRMRGQLASDQLVATAQLLGLEKLLERMPYQLSGGERQRVALGRAILRKPAAFLLDEPLSQLDAALRTEMRRELHLLSQRLRATMIYVTHDQAEGMTLADRLVVLRDGTIQQVGNPAEVYGRPANRFVACFVGSPGMSFLEGRLRRSDDHCELQGDAWSLRLPFALALPKQGGERLVSLGVRSHDLRVTDPASSAGLGGLRVALLEPLGPALLCTLQGNGLKLVAQVDSHQRLQIGQEVGVELIMNHAYWFDADTGVSLAAATG